MNKIENICVIDDDPICVFGIKKTLKKAHYNNKVVIYENGLEAIRGLKQYLEQGKLLPNIIFLDINMPIMDGWDFLDDFLKIPKLNRDFVNIYIISSSVDPADLKKVKEFNIINRYLIKPITIEKIETVIQEYYN
jgi:CheY-like chemotaxis protein